MRFKKINTFKIEQLHLDQGNYRFRKAEDQNQCILKIFNSNQQYFKNLMLSIAEDDLGEPLLAYINSNDEIIVLDGNRRLSALKVLHKPSLSPTSTLRSYAESLREKHTIEFKRIQAQVSDDHSLIMKTVYERHASGKGKARIDWSAYAAARFRFDEEVVTDDTLEWCITAILAETESRNQALTDFLESRKFSFETYRRIARKALEKNIISENIFSFRDKKIKLSANKLVLDDAVQKVESFLSTIKNGDITLSRGKKFASAEKVESYLEDFSLAPDFKTKSNGTQKNGGTEDNTEQKNNNDNTDDTSNNEQNSSENNNDSSDTNNTNGSKNHSNGISRSIKIENKLKKLKSEKLMHIYDSLCVVALKHSALLHVGTWAFFESLGRLIKEDADNSRGTINNIMKTNFDTKARGKKQIYKDYIGRMNYIYEFGDCVKHSGSVFPARRAEQLKQDMKTLEPVIIALIDSAIDNQKNLGNL